MINCLPKLKPAIKTLNLKVGLLCQPLLIEGGVTKGVAQFRMRLNKLFEDDFSGGAISVGEDKQMATEKLNNKLTGIGYHLTCTKKKEDLVQRGNKIGFF